MMDNTPAKKCRKSPKNRHIWPPFSPFYLRKCLTNSGRYRLHKPVTDWLETLPHSVIRTEYVREIPIGHN